MHKKSEINQTKIKGGCQSGRKVVTHNFKSDLPLASCRIESHLHSAELDEVVGIFGTFGFAFALYVTHVHAYITKRLHSEISILNPNR